MNVPPSAAGGPWLTVMVTTLLPLELLTPELLLLELPLLELLLVELPLEPVEPLGLLLPPPPQPARTHRPSNTVQRKCALMPRPRY